ncbi:MAG TPA: hypothetical protein VM099_05225 [Gemmatimonadaceae bacterium]|nr:hypothetical protein [Gemmatimonadaceae bacterium]
MTPYELYYGRSGDEETHHIERRNKVRDDISRRLRPICANFSDAEFDKLVDTMTDRKLKGEQRAAT